MMTSRHILTIAPPQGRSMLNWSGKCVLRSVNVPVIRLMETFDAAERHDVPGDATAGLRCPALFQGDNKDVLAYLLDVGLGGKVKLIYIDPPFDTGEDFACKLRLRGQGAQMALVSGARLGEKLQYIDQWSADSYLQFMYDRLLLLRELLADDGTLWLHCDYRRVHYLRLLLEEVFGAQNYLNTISWRSQTARGAKVNAFYFPNSTQHIQIFARNRAAPPTWHAMRRQHVMTEAEAAAAFMRDEQGFFRTSDPGSYSFESLAQLYAEGRLYAPYGGRVIVDGVNHAVYASNGGNISVKYYLQRLPDGKYAVERAIDNLWEDIPGLGTTPCEDLGYPTQKTEALLTRILSASTDVGDLVLDCFGGSGTTVAVAQKMGRRWVACDSNPGAVQTMTRRAQSVMLQQQALLQGALSSDALKSPLTPGELATVPNCFEVYRAGTEPVIAPNAAQSPCAQVSIQRISDVASPVICVQMTDYSSQAIRERLDQNAQHSRSVHAAGWRAMVDSVMIDPAYDGEVFRVRYTDVPQSRHDLVCGEYAFPAPAGPTTVAVRITDVLGDEVWVRQQV
jgi:DNA modification methylase